MVFLYPHVLWMLLIIPLLPLVLRFHYGRNQFRYPVLQTFFRVLAVTLLVLALARPTLIWQASSDAPAILISQIPVQYSSEDLASIEDQINRVRHKLSGQAHVIIAGKFPRLLSSDEIQIPGYFQRAVESWQDSSGSFDLEAALQLAASQLSGHGRIEIWTDGFETHGKADRELIFLSKQGVDVTIHPLPSVSPSVLQLSVRTPNSVGIGQPATVRLQLDAKKSLTADISLYHASGNFISSVKMAIPIGASSAEMIIPHLEPGLHSYQLRIQEKEYGAVLAERQFPILVAGALQIVVIEQHPQAATSAALTSLLGRSARVVTRPVSILENISELAHTDAVVIADIPEDDMSLYVKQNIKTLLKQGISVIFSGGPQSFGAGGYAGSELANLLPVRMPQEQEKADPSASIAIIIDTSGSMEGTRISLAKEVARIAIRRLTPHDKAGIVEFYGSRRWAAPMQSAANLSDLNRAINRLTAGGGTLILPAIEEAAFALRNVNTRSRHVVIITDGGVESGPFEQLVRKMANDGISTSTVLVGPAQHSSFLANIAQWGRGHFYQVPDRFNVPELLFKQPVSQAVPPYVENPVRLFAPAPYSIIDGIDFTAAPPVQGYVRTEAKETAEKILMTVSNEPILARWRYGRGYVGVITTQLGTRWSSQLSQWPPMATVLSNFFRASVPHSAEQTVEMNVNTASDQMTLDIRSLHSQAETEPIEIVLNKPDGTAYRQKMVEPVKAGQWSCVFSRVDAGNYVLQVYSADRTLRGSAAVKMMTPDEIRQSIHQENLMDTFNSLRQRIRGTASVDNVTRYMELWPYAALLSLVVMLLHILIRRLPLRMADRSGVRA